MKIQPFSLIQDNLQNNRKLLQHHYLPLHSFNMIYAHNTDNNLQYLYI